MYRNIFSLQMFLSYLELSLSDCAPLVTEVPGQFNYTGCKTSIICHMYSGFIFITVLFKCLLLVHFLQHMQEKKF